MELREATKIALLASVLATAAVGTVAAEGDEMPAQVERRVVGWLSGKGAEGGGELVVRREARGERLVDGEGTDFFFELTEVRDAADGTVKTTYRHGTPSGAAHPQWEEAGAADAGAAYVEQGELIEGERRWSSPDGRWMLTTFGGSRKIEVEHPRRGLQHVCVSKERLVLLDADSRRVRVWGDWVERGEQASKQGEAYCPQTTWRAWWHPESEHWAVIRRVTLTGALVEPPEVVAGPAAIAQGEAADGVREVLAARRPLADEVGRWEKGPAREGIVGLYEGRWRKAKNALEWAISREDGDAARDAKLRLPLAMALARLGQSKEADRQARRALEPKEQTDDAWSHAQAAAAYYLSGSDASKKKAETHLAAARQKATSYAEMVRVGELFRYVDLKKSNAILVQALKGDDARSTDEAYRYGFRLLVEGLIDAGLHEQAEILFGKFEPLPPRMQALKFRGELDRSDDGLPEDAHRRAARQLFAEPGLCQGYLNFGRVLAADGDLQGAMRQFRTARVCDGDDADVYYFLGTTGLQLGELEAARRHIGRYLDLAVPRDGDGLRARRRMLAERIDRRLAHEGAVLNSVRCGPGAMGGLECRGVVDNTGEQPLEDVVVRAVRLVQPAVEAKGESPQAAGEPKTEVVTEKKLGAVEAGGARTFSMTIRGGSDAGLALEAGRDDEEFEVNRTTVENK